MATPSPKTPSLLLEAIKFAGGIDRETPYEDLTKVALDAGWVWHLRQADVSAVHPAGMLVQFDVMLGKTDSTDLTQVDTISVMVQAGQGPLSSAARNLATASLIHLFFGRLPPAPERPAEPVNDERHMQRNSWQTDEPANAPRSTSDHLDAVESVAVVERRTPDGLPIFGDLYALGSPGPVVVDAVLNEVESVLPDVSSSAALIALWQENVEAMQYVQDLGTSEQRQDLKRMLDRRKAQLESSDVAPRRRSANVVN